MRNKKQFTNFVGRKEDERMFDKSLLDLFEIDNAKATRNGDFLPEYVSGKIKYEWDGVNKCYTDRPRAIVLSAFFYALRKSRL